MQVKSLIGPLVTALVNAIYGLIDLDDIRMFEDKQLDKLEDKIESTPNKYDDAAIPLIRMFRELTGVPDVGKYADSPIGDE